MICVSRPAHPECRTILPARGSWQPQTAMSHGPLLQRLRRPFRTQFYPVVILDDLVGFTHGKVEVQFLVQASA